MKSGLQLDKEPWLLPGDAFPTMRNAFLRDGVLEKRKGISAFLNTGAGHPITGIFEHQTAINSKILLVTDTKRLFYYNGTALVDLDGADYWTGTRLISFANYNGVTYMANDSDVCRYWDGTNLGVLQPALIFGTMDSAAFLAVFKERLIAFKIYEGGALYKNRIRWSVAGSPFFWLGGDLSSGEYLDIPTGDTITGFSYLADEIIVWCEHSTWLLRYTGNSSLPFRLDCISPELGCSAGLSPVTIGNRVLAVGGGGIIGTTGSDVGRIDTRLKDFVLSWNQANIGTCFGILLREQRQAWIFYPYTTAASTPNRALVFDYENNVWANLEISGTCVGLYSTAEAPPKWSDLSASKWGDVVEKWVDPSLITGYPLALMGRDNGTIVKLNRTDADEAATISFEVKSSKWNPFSKQGLKARLGKIEFLVEANANTNLSVDFFKDGESSAYMSQTLSFAGDGDKAWVRLFSGVVGDAHQIRLFHDEANPVKIHAITPWFSPAGRL